MWPPLQADVIEPSHPTPYTTGSREPAAEVPEWSAAAPEASCATRVAKPARGSARKGMYHHLLGPRIRPRHCQYIVLAHLEDIDVG